MKLQQRLPYLVNRYSNGYRFLTTRGCIFTVGVSLKVPHQLEQAGDTPSWRQLQRDLNAHRSTMEDALRSEGRVPVDFSEFSS